MKLSVSLPEEDIDFIDDYAGRRGSASRSAVLHRAIDLLRASELEDAYAAAFDEWDASEDGELWSATAADGLADAAR
ncbi:ribbon-helix-helix domain-containing protein [Catellatospora paridis]|uniref:ribbon-helix-helix domain-containing protein n=1 Tax=Catellatospora paridis TaxID=1617086 RepID=UPI0012D3EAED|nr:ribbon-helix-helix domain-containing protein [Catellatospora paridis]